MPLVGNLRDFALHDFLYLVDRGHKTGSLLLDRPASDEAAHLYFDRGKLLAVIHPQRRERLGEMLVRLGKITPEQLAQALHLQQMGKEAPLGQILVETGAIAQAELQACIQQQIEEAVYDLFGWREGEFQFQAGQRPAPDDVQSLVPLPVENIIMEGVRRVDELGRIREHIPSNDVIVRFVDRPQEKAANINMSADEWRVFARINGRLSIDQIAEKSGMTAFEVSSIVYGFVTAGLVEIQQPPQAPKLAPKSAPRPASDPTSPPAVAAAPTPEPPKQRFMDRLIGRKRS